MADRCAEKIRTATVRKRPCLSCLRPRAPRPDSAKFRVIPPAATAIGTATACLPLIAQPAVKGLPLEHREGGPLRRAARSRGSERPLVASFTPGNCSTALVHSAPNSHLFPPFPTKKCSLDKKNFPAEQRPPACPWSIAKGALYVAQRGQGAASDRLAAQQVASATSSWFGICNGSLAPRPRIQAHAKTPANST